jgi:hypothetical protein
MDTRSHLFRDDDRTRDAIEAACRDAFAAGERPSWTPSGLGRSMRARNPC